MKKRILLLIVVTLTLGYNFKVYAQTTIIVRSNGFTYAPDEIFASPGDTINFSIGSFHDVVEVSQETWDAGDTINNGGFRLPFGGGKLLVDALGSYYFVCTPHASLGMKGIIHVQIPSSAIVSAQEDITRFNIFPNPASGDFNLSFTIANTTLVNIDLIDISGRIIQNLINNSYQSGNYTESFNVADLQPGRYFIQIQTSEESRVESLFIID